MGRGLNTWVNTHVNTTERSRPPRGARAGAGGRGRPTERERGGSARGCECQSVFLY